MPIPPFWQNVDVNTPCPSPNFCLQTGSNMAKYFLMYRFNNGILAHTLRFNRITAIKINKFLHLVCHHVHFVWYHHFLCWCWPLTREIWNLPSYKAINKCSYRDKRPSPFSKKPRPKCPWALRRRITVY